MIRFKKERELNEKIAKVWLRLLKEGYQEAYKVQEERGSTLDVTPLHHRLQPEGLVHEVRKKGNRLESLLGQEGWETSTGTLEHIAEEALDIANYAMFLRTLAMMLVLDAKGELL